MKEEHIFIDYCVCKVTDYVRVIQCYICLVFGQFAKKCKTSLCDHCSGIHETMDCINRSKSPLCGNSGLLWMTSLILHWIIRTVLFLEEDLWIKSIILIMVDYSNESIIDDLRACHVNYQSLFAHLDEFWSFFINAGYLIICESWLTP